MELIRVGRAEAGSDEHLQCFPVALEVIETPRDLGSDGRRLGGFFADEYPRAVQRLLERRERVFVVTQLEQRRAEAVQGVEVVGILLQGRLECGNREVISTEAESAPREAAVQPLPRRPTLESGLEFNDGPAEVTQEVVGPRQERSRLVVLGIEDCRVGEEIARLGIFPRLEKSRTVREARLRAHASTEGLKHP